VDLHLDHSVELQPLGSQHFIQRFGLGDRAREPIQDEAALGIGLVDALGNQPDHDVIRDELSRLHDRLGLFADLGAGRDRSAQHVARGELPRPVAVLDALGLGALSGTRRTQKYEIHPRRPLSRDLRMSPSYWWAMRCDCTCAMVSMVTVTTI